MTGNRVNEAREGVDKGQWKIPEHSVHVYGPRVSRWALVIPVINEGLKFHAQLERMRPFIGLVDIVVADGGSSDGSMDDLEKHGIRAVLIKKGSGALSAQLRMAFSWCLLDGYEGIIIIDGNGKDGVDAIPLFVERLEQGLDMVQGSRYVPGGVAINTPLDRHLAVRLLHAPLISLASRKWWTDTTNGFRGFSSSFLADPRVAPFRDVFDTYNLHYYLSIRSSRLGFRCCEVPVTRAYPAKGKTPTKISGMRGRMLIMRQLLMSVAGCYNPKEGPKHGA